MSGVAGAEAMGLEEAKRIMVGESVGVGGAGSDGVKEEAGVCHITAAEGLGDGRDVHATVKTRAQGSG